MCVYSEMGWVKLNFMEIISLKYNQMECLGKAKNLLSQNWKAFIDLTLGVWRMHILLKNLVSWPHHVVSFMYCLDVFWFDNIQLVIQVPDMLSLLTEGIFIPSKIYSLLLIVR